MFINNSRSNDRNHTDEYLVNMTTSEFSYEENKSTIEDKKQQMEFIEITDEQIAKVRGEFDEDRGKGYNSLSVGDAMSICLAKEFKEYEGLQDPNEIEIMEEGEPANTRLTEKGLESEIAHLTASSEEAIMNPKKRKKEICDSYYDFDNNSTLYFLK